MSRDHQQRYFFPSTPEYRSPVRSPRQSSSPNNLQPQLRSPRPSPPSPSVALASIEAKLKQVDERLNFLDPEMKSAGNRIEILETLSHGNAERIEQLAQNQVDLNRQGSHLSVQNISSISNSSNHSSSITNNTTTTHNISHHHSSRGDVSKNHASNSAGRQASSESFLHR